MSDSIEDRKKAFENRFAHDEEMKFRAAARRRKLLGLWAAENMAMSEEESLEYAMTIVRLGIDDNTPGAVINKIMEDVKKKGINFSESDIRTKNQEFEILAIKQLTEE